MKLNQQVTLVQWHDNQEAPVIITCENDQKYMADHVIVTSSLAFLQRNHTTLFEPSLPNTKTDSLARMAMGKVNKIFLLFEKPFWTPGNGGIKLAWDDAEKDSRHNIKSYWFRGIFAFDEVLNNPNVLGAWLAGDEAEYMETLTDAQVIETCTQLLRKFPANPSLPAPTVVMRSKWCTNPLTLGS